MTTDTTTDRAFSCHDDSGCEIEITSTTAEGAAREYVTGGEWGEKGKTCWISVWVREIGDDESNSYLIEIEPTVPDCDDGEHDWRAPHSLVGGLRANPGVFGKGGGIVCTEVCVRCACTRITDTWAQHPSTGEQGLTSVEYVTGCFEFDDHEAGLLDADDDRPAGWWTSEDGDEVDMRGASVAEAVQELLGKCSTREDRAAVLAGEIGVLVEA